MPLVPEWFRPVAEYMLREGLPETLRIAAIALVASVAVVESNRLPGLFRICARYASVKRWPVSFSMRSSFDQA
jgi:hypothetical protein